MRLRRRVRPHLFPPVAQAGGRRVLIRNTPEMDKLRKQEKLLADSNDVADFAIMKILSQREIGNFLKSQIYREAIERFSDRLPAHEIRTLVDATIFKERYDREQAERRRRELAVRQRTRGAEQASVVSYRLRAAGLTA